MCITIIVFLMHYLDHFLAINPIERFKNSSYIRSKVARKKKLSHKINISPAVRVYIRCANRLFIRKESNLAKIQTYRIVLDLPPTLHHKTYYYHVGNYSLFWNLCLIKSSNWKFELYFPQYYYDFRLQVHGEPPGESESRKLSLFYLNVYRH